MSFLGSITYSIDSKKRIFIPSKFREDLGNTFYITRNIDNCLTIYTEEEWAAFRQKLNRIPDSVGVAAREHFFSAAQLCQPDSNGRIILPDSLIKYAEINKNVVFVGTDDKITVWSEENWSVREAERDREAIRNLMFSIGI